MATAAAGPLIRGAGAQQQPLLQRSRPSLGRRLALPFSRLLIPEPALIGKCFRFLLQELLQQGKQIFNQLLLLDGRWDKGGGSWW